MSLTHVIYNEHALYIYLLHNVGLPPMKSENKLTFPTPTGAAPPSRRESPRTTLEIPPGETLFSRASNTTLGKPLRYNILNHEECQSLQ